MEELSAALEGWRKRQLAADEDAAMNRAQEAVVQQELQMARAECSELKSRLQETQEESEARIKMGAQDHSAQIQALHVEQLSASECRELRSQLSKQEQLAASSSEQLEHAQTRCHELELQLELQPEEQHSESMDALLAESLAVTEELREQLEHRQEQLRVAHITLSDEQRLRKEMAMENDQLRAVQRADTLRSDELLALRESLREGQHEAAEQIAVVQAQLARESEGRETAVAELEAERRRGVELSSIITSLRKEVQDRQSEQLRMQNEALVQEAKQKEATEQGALEDQPRPRALATREEQAGGGLKERLARMSLGRAEKQNRAVEDAFETRLARMASRTAG